MSPTRWLSSTPASTHWLTHPSRSTAVSSRVASHLFSLVRDPSRQISMPILCHEVAPAAPLRLVHAAPVTMRLGCAIVSVPRLTPQRARSTSGPGKPRTGRLHELGEPFHCLAVFELQVVHHIANRGLLVHGADRLANGE